ncbi:hypothetical protein Ae356Ps1_6232c [Pseudonocardia sp. Ae356_Ps1]|nr:hypothetical protein Ae356Ps1_6232c [Pseudonocardia sp. Ae356_Ps1]
MTTYGPGGLDTAAARQVWDHLHLSRYPLATDDFDAGCRRMPRTAALRRRHIEVNPNPLIRLLVIDVDHPDAVLRALSSLGNHPMPAAIIENPANGHAHAVWPVTVPVNATNYGSRQALCLAQAIEEALRRAVDGDPAYTGRMMKNPLSPDHLCHLLSKRTYTLRQMQGVLAPAGHMPSRGWHAQRRRAPVGYGRNETLFHSVRQFGYRAIRHHWGDPDGFRATVSRELALRNADFSVPLSDNELDHIGKSISGWTIHHSRMWNDGPAVYDATFITIQAARGRKGAAKGGAARAEQSRRLRALAETLAL